jgi:hypothetical protein
MQPVEFENILSACLHDKDLIGDTIVFSIAFSNDLKMIESMEILSHGNHFTSIDAYSSDDIEEFIFNEIKTSSDKKSVVKIVCQVYGDFWKLKEA